MLFQIASLGVGADDEDIHESLIEQELLHLQMERLIRVVLFKENGGKSLCLALRNCLFELIQCQILTISERYPGVTGEINAQIRPILKITQLLPPCIMIWIKTGFKIEFRSREHRKS